MEPNSPIAVVLFLLIGLAFVAGGFYVLFKLVFPFFGRTIIRYLRASGYSREAVMKSLQNALMPAGLKQPLIRYAETLYSKSEKAGS